MGIYLNEIVSVSGKPGLHKVVGRRTNGLIVESLDGQGKRFPTNLSQKVSFLSDISMYTYEGDAALADVLKSLHDKISGGLAVINKKNSGDEIRSFFREILEDFDEDQVYNSDIIKLVNWYELLKDKLDFDNLIEEEESKEDKQEEE
ncbi:MAG: DUF5606 domain-containing protein [Bacteroidia bacterium]